MNEHETIWLQPWCSECDKSPWPSRQWCQDDVWEPCEQCGALPVKYTRSPQENADG